jgi:hypothetical protein
MIIHDARLRGNPPTDLADNIYEVDDKVDLSHALHWIAQYAKMSGRLTNLYVMCHGAEECDNLRNQTSMNRRRGGFGLQLCADWLYLVNVQQTVCLTGLIDRITLFVCAPADTAPGNEGTVADGMRFCGELALITGAEVIAPTQTQMYVHPRSFWDWLTGGDHIDFGDWEGPVYSFSSDHPHGIKIN